jgi:sigma-B regulation protein RsbU (phosphoserine phosphatase)
MTDNPSRDERLRVLEAVTDTTLARLDLDKILMTLLEQLLDLMSVDTATVLLYDAASNQLTAAAAVGIEEEVLQGVQVPVGAGFAGRIAATRQPKILDRVDETTVVNPLLWAKRIQALLGVPMLAHDQLLGVLHVGSTTPRRFTDADTATLQLVADRLALAAQAHTSSAERAATAALQRSLLPSHLPVTANLEFAARYVPGSETGLGGDWYDVFHLPEGRLGIVIGDVVGHGLHAAVIMGRLRSALRAYALDSIDPGLVLAKLDRKATHFEHGSMATIGYAVTDSSHRQWRMSLAGHLPPLMIAPNRPADFLELPVDPPVGHGLATTHRRSATVELPPGGLIAFYTDGLVERRDQALDVGMALLRGAITTDSPDLVCAHIMATMIGTQPATDDIALLITRHTEASGT